VKGESIRRDASRLEVRWIIGCAAACSLLVWACGREDSGAPQRAETAPAPASAAAERPGRLAPGTARLRYESGRVTLDANAAPVRPLLERLAAEARFELEIEPVDWPPLSASFADLSLAEALARVIGNRDYTAQWRASAGGAEPHLALLRVGAEVVADTAASRKQREFSREDQDDRAKGKKSSVAGGVAGTLAHALRQRPPESETQEALLAKLQDSSAQVRRDAAAEIRPEGEGVHALSQLLANDPDPGVRAAATAGLEVADDPAAVQALIAGLGDPDPSVVVEVLDSLEFAGDATVIPRIVPLLQHPDSAVREAAQDAIDFLGD
jgi:HEAT repeats